MSDPVVLTAAIPWNRPSHIDGSTYAMGHIANLRAGSKVPLTGLRVRDGRKHKEPPIYGFVTRGRSTPSGYRIEVVVHPHRVDGRHLLDEVDFGMYVDPEVRRLRLVGVGCSVFSTWPEAELRRSPLPPTPEVVDRVLALLAEAPAR
jgi:hypothetical protein